MHVTIANHLKSPGRTIFRGNRIDGICPENPSSPQAISHGFPSIHLVAAPSQRSSPPPCRPFHPAPSERSSPQAIPHGFPSVPLVASISLLPHGPLPKLFPTASHPVIASISLLPNGALPKLFPTVSLPSTLSSLPSRSFPTELSPSYFRRFPFHPPSRRFRIAPSPRSSPQAISHGFLSVQPVVASIRSFPTELPPCYSPRFPLRPPCRRFHLAPS